MARRSSLSSTARVPSQRPMLAAGALLAAAVAARPACADAILKINDSTVSSYLPATATAGQDVLPLLTQRGTYVDGSLRAPAGLGWAAAANPFEPPAPGMARLGDIDLANGAYAPTDVDLALPAPGASRWVIGRSFNGRQDNSLVGNGPQGYNWFQLSQPELKFHDADANAGTKGDDDVLYIVYGADRFLEFDRTAANADTFRGVNGAAGVVKYVSGSPDTFVYYDPSGTRSTFFGGNTSSGRADWQFWKIEDAAGNTAYAGDKTTASTAASSGYNTDKTVALAFDGASNDGRRYTYSYTSTGGRNRLTGVAVHTKSGGTWASPTGLVKVAQVDYAFYVNADAHGSDGDLKLVTLSTSLSDSDSSLSVPLVRKKHYRYYDQSWADSAGRRGVAHAVKMVVGYEGCRKFDWSELGAGEPALDDGFLSASDSDLMAYADAYLEYENASTQRGTSVTFNGQCGCSGGVAGTFTLAYAGNGSFSNNTGYDATWKTRTVLAQPDGTYLTQYFDETGATLSKAVTDADPVSATGGWFTQVLRTDGDANLPDGLVKEVRSPANIGSGYTHSTGAFTGGGSGLITLTGRVLSTTSATLQGLPESSRFKDGTGGTEYYTSWNAYEASVQELEVVSGVTVPSPHVATRRAFHTASTSATDTAKYDETSVAYVYWSGTNTSVDYVAVKQETTTLPKVSTAKNGRGTGANDSTEVVRYLREDGSAAFQSQRMYTDTLGGGTFSLTYLAQNSDGLRSAAVQHADSDVGGYSASTWSIQSTNTSGKDACTETAFDAQGRPSTVTLPDGRQAKHYYSALADGRMVSLSFPRFSGSTHYGPATYTVTNHAGRVEFQGAVALVSVGITTAQTGWIGESESDPILALDIGTLCRMTTTVHDSPGTRVEETRAYFAIPASGAGSAGTNYDATKYGYDAMGRRWRIKDATGTIDRTTFDALGRTYRRYTGTNDYSFTGGEASGPDNMVKVEELVYDAGAKGANSHLTKRTLYVEDSNTDKRETSYLHDVRGRAVVQIAPVAPHTLTEFDNLGRVVATAGYSSSTGLDAGDLASTLATNRVTLSKTFFDEQGRVWKTTRHFVDPSTGNATDNAEDVLDTLTWYDERGRVVKVDGEQLTKTLYDSRDRPTHRFVLAQARDSSGDEETLYADADDVADDIVLEEHQTTYESAVSDNVVMRAIISRHHDDYGGVSAGTGALDSNADGNAFKYTAANLSGRAQVTATWYDELDRPTDTVAYGTNGGSDFERKPSGLWPVVPSRSDTALVTTRAYNGDGEVYQTTDPRGLVTRLSFDDLGRKLVETRNYVNGTPSGPTGDDDVHTRWVYTTGMMTKMWVDLDGDDAEDADDQVTTYTYGVTKGVSAGDSKIASNRFLQKEVYPPQVAMQAEADRRVSHAYNALGQSVWRKDQDGNIFETDYDLAGRQTHRRVTTLASGFDNAVLRVSTVYESRGLVSTITQYDNATVGSGSVVDQVKYTLDGWGLATNIEQDRNSAVGAIGSTDDYEVAFLHVKSGDAGGRNCLVRTEQKLRHHATDRQVVTYDYLSSTSAPSEFDDHQLLPRGRQAVHQVAGARAARNREPTRAPVRPQRPHRPAARPVLPHAGGGAEAPSGRGVGAGADWVPGPGPKTGLHCRPIAGEVAERLKATVC